MDTYQVIDAQADHCNNLHGAAVHAEISSISTHLQEQLSLVYDSEHTENSIRLDSSSGTVNLDHDHPVRFSADPDVDAF